MNPADHAHAIEAWRRERLARLTGPDGWLTLVGLPWLEPGDNTIGGEADNAIVVAGLPGHLGTVHVDADGTAIVRLAAASSARIDGAPATQAVLRDDADPSPTIVRAGDISFFLVRRGERIGLRIRNTHAVTREHFAGLECFATDPAWRIDAEWRPAPPGETLAMTTVIGTLETHPVAGHAVFERDGQRCVLRPVVETPGDRQFFLVFVDQTSGRETYGAARFLYTEIPVGDRIVLDFNKAYNPPCAFTAFAACPMAPPENRLPLRVTAGEKTYAGGHGT